MNRNRQEQEWCRIYLPWMDNSHVIIFLNHFIINTEQAEHNGLTSVFHDDRLSWEIKYVYSCTYLVLWSSFSFTVLHPLREFIEGLADLGQWAWDNCQEAEQLASWTHKSVETAEKCETDWLGKSRTHNWVWAFQFPWGRRLQGKGSLGRLTGQN